MVGSRRIGGVVVVAISMVVVTACGVSDDAETTTGGSPAGAEDGLAMWCDDVAAPGPISETKTSELNPDMFLLGVLQRYADEHADTFGGLWIDQMRGGTVVLAFTDDPAAHEQAISALVPLPDDPIGIEPRPSIVPPTTTVGESQTRVDVVQVVNTQQALDNVQDDAAAAFTDGSVDVFSAGVSPDVNRVTLSLGPDAPDDARRIVAERLPAGLVCIEGGPPAEPDPSRPTTILPAAGTDPWITCAGQGGPFRLSDLENPPDLPPDHPLVLAIERDAPRWTQAFDGANPTAWRILVMSEDQALIDLGGGAVLSAVREGDVWALTGGSSGPGPEAGSPCVARAQLPDGLTEVSWGFDPAFPSPQPGDTVVHLLVNDVACSGGAAVLDRMAEPEFDDRGDLLVVGLAARTLEPAGKFQSCIGTMAEPYDLTLPEPLGTQVIADGTFLPPRPAGVSAGF